MLWFSWDSSRECQAALVEGLDVPTSWTWTSCTKLASIRVMDIGDMLSVVIIIGFFGFLFSLYTHFLHKKGELILTMFNLCIRMLIFSYFLRPYVQSYNVIYFSMKGVVCTDYSGTRWYFFFNRGTRWLMRNKHCIRNSMWCVENSVLIAT